MSEIRDYGYIDGNYLAEENTPKVDTNRRSQVFLATHEGENRLPFMKRSFISFSFGGKNIEDFDLILVSDGNYLQLKGYSDFEDIVSDYDILDGHYFWGTHYTGNEFNFLLITDGISEVQLSSFLSWFSPGKIRELILSEHPNRAIMARVSQAPELKLQAFEHKTTKKIIGREYKTSTTLYKGSIALTLISEEPYWYSKINIFGHLDNEGIYRDIWLDANGKERSVYDDPDAIKIALEDNIPISGMIQDDMLLGDNKYAITDTKARTLNNNETEENAPIEARVAGETESGVLIIYARVSGATLTENGIESLSIQDKGYFYYAGTAPSAPILEFTITPQINNEGYIYSPSNSYSMEGNNKPYNTIKIGSLNEKELAFTTPSIYTAYNQAIDIFKNLKPNQNWIDVREQIREKVKHKEVREWANLVINKVAQGMDEGITVVDRVSQVITIMRFLFLKDDYGNCLPATFTINNQTGRVTGKISRRYRAAGGAALPTSDWADYNFSTTYFPITSTEENTGDMIYSNHLIIEERNYPTENGDILAWNAGDERAKLNSHYITHDLGQGLQNVKLIYKNMYL